MWLLTTQFVNFLHSFSLFNPFHNIPQRFETLRNFKLRHYLGGCHTRQEEPARGSIDARYRRIQHANSDAYWFLDARRPCY